MSIELNLKLTFDERNFLMDTLAYAMADNRKYLEVITDTTLKESYELEILRLQELYKKLSAL